MFMLRLMILVGGVLVIAIAMTQVFIPIVRGTPLFPFFRRRHKLRKELALAREELGDAGLEVEAARFREKAERILHPDEELTEEKSTLHSVGENDRNPVQ